MSFSRNVTKTQLLREKKTLVTTEKIDAILQDKKELLIKRMNEKIDESARARKTVNESLNRAYGLLAVAMTEMGELKFNSVSEQKVGKMELTAKKDKLMDIIFNSLTLEERELPALSFKDTPESFYEARDMLLRAFKDILLAAAVEDALYKIREGLEKTQRLTSSIEKLVMPSHIERIRTITFVLEERDREELVRLKKIKKALFQRRG